MMSKLMKDLSGSSELLSGLRRLAGVADRAEEAVERLLERVSSGRAGKMWTSVTSRVPAPMLGFLIAIPLIASRQPSLYRSPQFRFEDGPQFFQNAYNHGLSSLLLLHAGYFHTIPRLVALIAAKFPLGTAPAVMSLFAILIQAWASGFMLSSRLDSAINPKWLRFGLWFMIVSHPNSEEMRGNMAHSQWYLALLAVAMLCARPPGGKLLRALEICTMALISVTGPFAMALAPLSWIGARQAGSHRRALAAVLTLGAVATAISVATHPRFTSPGVKHFWILRHMIAAQLMVGSLRGLTSAGSYLPTIYFDIGESLWCAIAAATLLWVAWKGSALIRWICLVGGLSFLTSLSSGATWQGLGTPGQGERYFFALGTGVVIALFAFLISSNRRWIRLLTAPLGIMLLLGVHANWRDRPITIFADLQSQLPAFESAPVGTPVVIRTSGDQASPHGWIMTLIKH